MASNQLCEPCSRATKSSVAVKYCSDCDEALCSDCFNVHGTFKAFKSHHVVDVKVTTDQSFAVNKFCPDHEDMVFEFFCSDHDRLCCRSCIAEAHRTCGKITPVDVAAKGVKSSSMFEVVASEVNNLKLTAGEIEKGVDSNAQALENSKDAAKVKIKNFKDKMINHLEQIEKNHLSELEDVYGKLLQTSEKHRKGAGKHAKQIHDIVKQFEFIKTHGSESQLFLFLHSLKDDLAENDKELEDFISNLKLSTLMFKETNTSSMIESFGTIKLKGLPLTIKHKSSKSQQVQIDQSGKSPTKMLSKGTTSLPERDQIWITNITVLRDGKLLLCNWGGKELFLLSEEGQYQGEIVLIDKPWNVTVNQKTDEAWVTLPKSCSVQLINTANMTLTKPKSLPVKCYGIALMQDYIALGGVDGKIYVMNKTSKDLQMIQVGEGKLYTLLSVNGKIYCCEADNGRLHCVGFDGSKLFTISSPGPISLSSDTTGNLYVLDWKSHRLTKLSPDGEAVAIMLSKKDGLNAPYCMAFNNNITKIFIVNYIAKNMLMFSCE